MPGGPPFFELLWGTQVLQNPTDGGLELLLAESYQIPVYFSATTATGNIVMGIPDNATDHGLLLNEGTTSSATSLHLLKTDTAYQVTTTGNLKLVLVVTAGAANTSFTVYRHTVVDTAAGTTIYSYTETDKLDSGQLFTTEVIEVSATANDFITIDPDTGSFSNIKAFFVEKPA